MDKQAIVLLSGGLDSITALAVAQSEGYSCSALSFDYGQKHNAELRAAKQIADNMKVSDFKVMKIDLSIFGGSALTDFTIPVPTEMSSEIPVTYVPARNTVFLSIALAWAEVKQANHIYIGVNAVDYSGYPDCRPEYIDAFERMANLATKSAVEGLRLTISTPLINKSKSEIIQLGAQLGVDYSLTVSCYQANKFGQACGECDACRLRMDGFRNAGVKDVTNYIDNV